MAIAILVPRLGWTMEEGVFEGWLKREGDHVQAGEMLFTLESEKASQEIEAIDSGVLRIPPDAPKPGDVVSVGGILGYLLAPGEQPPWEMPEAEKAGQPTARSMPVIDAGRAVMDQGFGTPPPLTTAAPASLISHALRPPISPRARRVARESGIDWTKLHGSGMGGRIREQDVRAALEHRQAAPPGRLIALSPVRKTIARRMQASLQATAPVTLTTEADATDLVNLHRQLQAAAAQLSAGSESTASELSMGTAAAAVRVVPTYTDLIVKLAAAALLKHPMLTAQWSDAGLVMPEGIHVGIAVDTDAGLLVPVVRDVPDLSVLQVATQSRTLIQQARSGRLSAEKMTGGTFTVTNLGMYGIDAFTPIIHAPQSAILGIGRVRREPAVHGDQIVPRDRITLSLTFDHRVIDGAPAARFLNTLRIYIENPVQIKTSPTGPWL